MAFYLPSSVFSGCCKLSSLNRLHINISQFSLDFPLQSVVKRVPELCLFGRWPFSSPGTVDLGREQRWLSFLASRLLAFEKGNSITCFHCTISLPVLTFISEALPACLELTCINTAECLQGFGKAGWGRGVPLRHGFSFSESQICRHSYFSVCMQTFQP